MIRQACFHRRGDAQRLMHSYEIVVSEIERDCVTVIFNLLKERGDWVDGQYYWISIEPVR